MQFHRQPQWDITPREAFALQARLADEVLIEGVPEHVELVAGVDLAFGQDGETGRAAAVVWRPATNEVVEEVVVHRPVTFPYVPGLLAFREGPLIQEALESLQHEPDLLMMDGQGIAHPRRLGIAAHVGVLLDRPTIGVAKSRLTGTADDLGPNPGDRTPLIAKDGEQIGYLLRTRLRSNPLWISPGHRITCEAAVDWVFRCCRGYRLPEPTRLADKLSKDR